MYADSFGQARLRARRARGRAGARNDLIAGHAQWRRSHRQRHGARSRQPSSGSRAAAQSDALELVSFGFDGPLVPDMTAGAPARAAALERLSRSGLAPMYADASMSLDGIEMIYLTAGASSCEGILEMSKTMDAVVAVMCSLAIVAPVAAPECFAAMTVAAALKLIVFLRGC